MSLNAFPPSSISLTVDGKKALPIIFLPWERAGLTICQFFEQSASNHLPPSSDIKVFNFSPSYELFFVFLQSIWLSNASDDLTFVLFFVILSPGFLNDNTVLGESVPSMIGWKKGGNFLKM